MKSFILNKLDIGFRRWSEYGLIYLHQLISFGNLRTFEQLRSDYGIPKTDFYRYLQLRTFLTGHKEWGKLIKTSPIKQLLIEIQTRNRDEKIISRLYNIFLSMNTQNSLWIKQRWEAEMDIDISQEAWEEVCSEAHRATSSNTLSRMSQSHSSSCWRNCGAHTANQSHIFWFCPKLKTFWEEVFDALKEVFQQDIPRDPTVALLGVIPK